MQRDGFGYKVRERLLEALVIAESEMDTREGRRFGCVIPEPLSIYGTSEVSRRIRAGSYEVAYNNRYKHHGAF